MALDDHIVDQLDDLINTVPESDCLDAFASHGFLTANICGPSTLTEGALTEAIVCDVSAYNEKTYADIGAVINTINSEIDRTIRLGERLELPCPLTLGEDPEASPLRAWALGFIDAVSSSNIDWHALGEQIEETDADEHAEDVARMLFPIMVAAGVLDEGEQSKVEAQIELCKSICLSIPDAISDLYLTYHSS